MNRCEVVEQEDAALRIPERDAHEQGQAEEKRPDVLSARLVRFHAGGRAYFLNSAIILSSAKSLSALAHAFSAMANSRKVAAEVPLL